MEGAAATAAATGGSRRQAKPAGHVRYPRLVNVEAWDPAEQPLPADEAYVVYEKLHGANLGVHIRPRRRARAVSEEQEPEAKPEQGPGLRHDDYAPWDDATEVAFQSRNLMLRNPLALHAKLAAGVPLRGPDAKAVDHFFGIARARGAWAPALEAGAALLQRLQQGVEPSGLHVAEIILFGEYFGGKWPREPPPGACTGREPRNARDTGAGDAGDAGESGDVEDVAECADVEECARWAAAAAAASGRIPVQQEVLYSPHHHFLAFDVAVRLAQQRDGPVVITTFLDHCDMLPLARATRLPHIAPLRITHSLEEALDVPHEEDSTMCVMLNTWPRAIPGNTMEGTVIRLFRGTSVLRGVARGDARAAATLQAADEGKEEQGTEEAADDTTALLSQPPEWFELVPLGQWPKKRPLILKHKAAAFLDVVLEYKNQGRAEAGLPPLERSAVVAATAEERRARRAAKHGGARPTLAAVLDAAGVTTLSELQALYLAHVTPARVASVCSHAGVSPAQLGSEEAGEEAGEEAAAAVSKKQRGALVSALIADVHADMQRRLRIPFGRMPAEVKAAVGRALGEAARRAVGAGACVRGQSEEQ